jgi:hypothetical protein
MTEEIHFRKTNNAFNLTDEQVMAALELRTNKVKEKLLKNIQEEYPMIDYEYDTSIAEVFLRLIDMSISEGMELVADRFQILHDYMDHMKEQKEFPPQITNYHFQRGRGISGILTPDGVFHKCGNAEHYIIAESIDPIVQHSCIYFSSSLIGDGGGVVSLSPFRKPEFAMTDLQEEWIEDNIGFFEHSQVEMYNNIFGRNE